MAYEIFHKRGRGADRDMKPRPQIEISPFDCALNVAAVELIGNPLYVLLMIDRVEGKFAVGATTDENANGYRLLKSRHIGASRMARRIGLPPSGGHYSLDGIYNLELRVLEFDIKAAEPRKSTEEIEG